MEIPSGDIRCYTHFLHEYKNRIFYIKTTFETDNNGSIFLDRSNNKVRFIVGLIIRSDLK